MSLKASFGAAIERVGTDAILLKDADSFPVKVSIQPVISFAEREASSAGLGMPERYKLYAVHNPGVPEISVGDMLLCRNRKYLVLRSEPVSVGSETLYIRGALRRCEDDG